MRIQFEGMVVNCINVIAIKIIMSADANQITPRTFGGSPDFKNTSFILSPPTSWCPGGSKAMNIRSYLCFSSDVTERPLGPFLDGTKDMFAAIVDHSMQNKPKKNGTK